MNELQKKHLLSKDKQFKEAYKNNLPEIEKVLEWQPGEHIVSELEPKDLIQLLSRYLNNDGVYTKNILHFLIRIERLLTWLCESSGVDVQAKFKEDAKKQAELIEQNIAKAKEEIKNSVK